MWQRPMPNCMSRWVESTRGGSGIDTSDRDLCHQVKESRAEAVKLEARAEAAEAMGRELQSRLDYVMVRDNFQTTISARNASNLDRSSCCMPRMQLKMIDFDFPHVDANRVKQTTASM